MAKSPELKRVYLRQVADRLEPWTQVRGLRPPRSGWIASIREALGMSRAQLAKRMGVDPTAVPHLEKREAAGKITLESLRRAAEAMDAQLVYAIVPKYGLSGTLQTQARKVAQARLGRVGHTMNLEAQNVGKEESANQEADLVNRLLLEWPRSLWDELEAPKEHIGK